MKKIIFLIAERIRARPILQPIANTTVYEGQNATLKCWAISDSMPHFQWLKWNSKSIKKHGGVYNTLKDGNHYEVMKRPNYDPDQPLLLKPSSERRFAPHGVQLIIFNVTKKDEGRYTCLVQNSEGYEVKHTYVIVRASKLELLFKITSVNILFYRTLHFCNVSGLLQSVKSQEKTKFFSWSKKNSVNFISSQGNL